MRNRYRDLRRETYELPSTAEGISSAVSHILSQAGTVYKLVVESGRGIIAYREKEGSQDLMEDEQTLDGTLRNSEIIEYENVEGSQFEKLFDMFHILSKENLYPVVWATGPDENDTLNQWLTFYQRGVPSFDQSGKESILGIPLVHIP